MVEFVGWGGQIYFLTPSPALCWVVVDSLSGNQVHSCFVFNYDMNDMMRRVLLEVL